MPTPKGAHAGLPLFVVGGLCAMVLFHGVSTSWGAWMLLNEMGHTPAIVFATGVSAWFGVVSISALSHVLRRVRALDQAAITAVRDLTVECRGQSITGQLVRATPDRLVLQMSRALPVGEPIEWMGVVSGVVERGGHRCRVRVEWPDDAQRRAFARHLYLRDPDGVWEGVANKPDLQSNV